MVDIRRGDQIQVLASAARTSDPSIDTYRVKGGEVSGLLLVIDVTSVTATPSVTFTIKGVDQVSGKTWDILASAAITGTGTTVLRVHPALTASANAIAQDVVPTFFTVTAVHADTDSITYSVAAYLV